MRATAARIDIATIAAAFVSSLRLRRFEQWSALRSFAFVRRLPVHEFGAFRDGASCRVCGAANRVHVFPSNAFATARRTGTGTGDSLRYALYDLTAFFDEAVTQPSDEDRAFFDLAISRIANVPATSKTFAAERALGIAFASRIDRKLFLGILGACGVLASPVHPGFWPEFVPFESRAGLNALPYTYPVSWWRRRFGVNRNALEAFGLHRFLTKATLTALD